MKPLGCRIPVLTALLLVTTALASACVTRSAGFGQTAELLAKGKTEAAVSPGISYQSQTGPESTNTDGNTVIVDTSAISIGATEGNLAYGLSEKLGLNLHVSPAGIQPGLKIRVSSGSTRIAILPAIGLGHIGYSATEKTDMGSSVNEEVVLDQTRTTALLGAKALLSTESGFYAGIGYDLQYVSQQETKAGDSSSTTSHNFGFGIGYEIRRSGVLIRPELSGIFIPSISQSRTEGSTTTTSTGGSEFYLFPNVTIAVR